MTIFDALTYAGNRANVARPRRRPAVPVRPRRHLRPGRRRHSPRRARRRRALRGRVARRPLDQGSVRLRLARTATAPTCCATSPARSASERFLHVSTDEVYGSIAEGSFTETDVLTPRSPYSAAKAGSDLIALSYWTTYGLPGRRHPVEQPVRPVPVPGEGHPAVRHEPARRLQGPAVRRRHERARLAVRRRQRARRSTSCCGRGRTGEIYNIGAHNELPNIELTRKLLALCDRDESCDPARRGPPRPRPALLDHDRQDRRPRLADGARPRRGTRRHRAVVSHQSSVVGAAEGPRGVLTR